MRLFTILLCLITSLGGLSAQGHASKVHVTKQEFRDRIDIYATNQNPIPVSVEIEFQLKGLTENNAGRKFHVIPSSAPRQQIASLIKEPNTGWSMKYNVKVYLGDFYSEGHDSTYVYTLPFEKGKSYRLSQGYNGTFSHEGENAIDFIMPEGTPIYAMRDGTVADVIEHHNDGCANRSCLHMANSVLVYHVDGSFSRYSHLMVNGAAVNLGERVEVGQLIGYSGNTGWSSKPHLHFSIFEIWEGNRSYSIPTRFITDEGAIYLEEGRSYRRPE